MFLSDWRKWIDNLARLAGRRQRRAVPRRRPYRPLLEPLEERQVPTVTTLYSFNPYNGTDGTYPEAGLLRDASGDLFGTTSFGGPGNYGTVFELARQADGTYAPPPTS